MDLSGRIIYVMEGWRECGFYKIGCTGNIFRRYPKRLRDRIVCVIHVPDGANMYEMERDVHQSFARKRVAFETFALSEQDIAELSA